MEAQAIKPKLGRWLNIKELEGFITDTPSDIVQGIPINRKLLEIASEFVERQNGWWEHPDWESFLNILSTEGYNLSEEVQASIGKPKCSIVLFNRIQYFRSLIVSRINTIPGRFLVCSA